MLDEAIMQAAMDTVARWRRTGPFYPYGSIGASVVGNPCTAAIALNLRGMPSSPSTEKAERVFILGDIIEDIVVADIKAAGIPLVEKDGLTGRQFRFTGFGGHAVVKVDGLISWPKGTEIAEIKSMRDEDWKALAKAGLQKAEPKYYDQIQMAMGLSGYRTGVIFVYNKNTSEYHVERVAFDEDRWRFLEAKIEIAMTNQAERISNDPSDFRCRGCFKREACHGHAVIPTPKCNHCAFSYPDTGKRWWCLKKDRIADEPCEFFVAYQPKPAS